MKEFIELLKKRNKIVIWAIGIIILWFIWPSYEYEPKFIRENELVTWDMAERMICVVLIILGIQKLAGNYLFRDEDQDNWSKDVEKRLEAIEARPSNEPSEEEFNRRIINELERNLLEFDQRIKSDLQMLKESHSKLENRVCDHLQDCPHIFKCNNCDHEDDIFNFISNDDGDLMCPTCHSSAAVEEKTISRHLQPAAINKLSKH